MIEFIPDVHLYLVNGVITPSVSQILSKTIFKDKYAAVDERTLARAATFGTNVHKAIEEDNPIDLTDEELEVFNKWLELKETNFIVPRVQEQRVHYKGLYCGTYDMEALVLGYESLCDVKTTYQLDEEYISWQLSMYQLASGKEFKKLYAIWVPKKGKAKVVEIKRKTKEQIEDLVNQYYEMEKELWN